MDAQIIVVGGGPAGMMAAITAAKNGAAVALWERNDTLGKKLAITGKGRCNITNNAPLEELIKNMPGNGAFLYGAFSRFSAADTMDFFNSLGVELKTERGRRVFPASDNAKQVVAALEKHITDLGINIHYQRRAARLIIKDGCLKGLMDTRGKKAEAAAVILACGGISYPATGSSGDGYALAQGAGHSLVTPRAALAPLETVETWPTQLAGLSLKNAALSATYQQRSLGKEFGEMLFTHFGVSGPTVLTLSRAISALPQAGQGVQLHIDLKPALSIEKLQQRLLRNLSAASRKHVANALAGLLPSSLLPVLLQLAQIDSTKAANQLSRAERTRLISLLKALPLTVKSTRPIAEAIVTAGGINIKEIDPRTMESKKLPGLFLVGEMLDIDGFTGGYNLQAAWAAGYTAGIAAPLYTSYRY